MFSYARKGMLFFSSNKKIKGNSSDPNHDMYYISEANMDKGESPKRFENSMNSKHDDFGIVFKDDVSGYFSSGRNVKAAATNHDMFFFKLDDTLFNEINMYDVEALAKMKADSIQNELDKLAEQKRLEDSVANAKEVIKNRLASIDKMIFFKFDSYEVQEKYKTTLDEIASLLKDNKSINVSIGAHTDSKSTEEYNQKLSEERAEEVANYLMQKGVCKKQILAQKAYGESKLLNDCDNGTKCPESVHAKNRRVEFQFDY